tara:strand:- start:136470 stop:138446 length:1977 start_codon:yes stop_codon:yes gene_type:complete
MTGSKAIVRKPIRLRILAGLVLLAALFIYLPGLSGPLFFDDMPALTANEFVHITGSSFDEWRVAAFSSGSGPLRRPIAMLSFAANYALAGEFSTAGLKAVNLAIHLVIAVLLYLLFRSILTALAIGRDSSTSDLIAVTAAAIWLLHPLHVSTVLYAVQRMAQLAALFVVAGLWVFMRYRQRWFDQGAPAGEVLAASLWLLLLTTLAALSKESGALLPWLIIVLEVCIYRGVWAGRSITWLRGCGWMLLVLPVVAVVLVLALSPETLQGGYSGREFTLEERLLTQARVLWHYLGWICLPNIGGMGFQHDDIAFSAGLFAPVTTILALLGWPVVLLTAFSLRRRYPLLLLAVLFFLVGQSLESSVIPLEMVYEHRNYLPSTLVCLLLAWLLVIPVSRGKHFKAWYPVGGALVILCMLLFIRVHTWSDELSLSRTNQAQHPESSRSNYFYANALLRQYRRSEQLGLTQREKGESLLLSRHYFERMYQTNNRDVAALVMLFYLDSHYFTELQGKVDWLAKLDVLLSTRTMQPSDWNALATLFDIFTSNPAVSTEATVTGLLDKLSARYPDSVHMLQYRYKYQSAMEADSAQLLPLLQRAQELDPGSFWPYYQLLYEYARDQDAASMYHYAGLWLFHDSNRLSIHQIKALFTLPVEPMGPSLD